MATRLVVRLTSACYYGSYLIDPKLRLHMKRSDKDTAVKATTLPKTIKAILIRNGYEILRKLNQKALMHSSPSEFLTLFNCLGSLKDELSLSFEPHAKELPEWLNRLLTGLSKLSPFAEPHTNETKRTKYLFGIICIVWALYEQARLDGNDFKRGSFKLIDPDNKLLNLLKGYVELATGYKNPGFWRLFGGNEFAYSRDPANNLSSHYADPSFNSSQYGIDARLEPGGDLINMLPHDSGHLLFGSVDINDKQYTFIKAERVGLGNMIEYAEHSLHFLAPSENKASDRREKDIPAIITQSFEALLGKLEILEPNHSAINKKHWTISNMVQVVEQSMQSHPELATVANGFFEALKQCGFEHDAHIRTGNEVIIDLNIFAKPTQNNKPLLFTKQNCGAFFKNNMPLVETTSSRLSAAPAA